MASEASALMDPRDQFAPMLMKLRARDEISAEEEEILRASITEVRDYAAGKTVVRAGTMLTESNLVVSGIAARYKDLADGQRQILELHVAGDYMDLHGFLLKRLEHNIGALTPLRLAIVPHDRMRVITETSPHLARMLWFSTLLDGALHRERILSIGRRTAIARIAHLLCEISLRLKVVGLGSEHSFPLPLTQADLADVTGLTAVHVNRMLKQLRDEGLLTFRGGEVTIHDWEGLQRVAEFTPGYLYLERLPR